MPSFPLNKHLSSIEQSLEIDEVSSWRWDDKKGLEISDNWFHLAGKSKEEQSTLSNLIGSQTLVLDDKFRIIADWWEKSIHPEDKKQARAVLDEHINSKKGGPYVNRYRVVRADGSIVHIQSTGYSEWNNGRLVEFSVVQVPMTGTSDRIQREVEKNTKAIAKAWKPSKAELTALVSTLTLIGSAVSEPVGKALSWAGNQFRSGWNPPEEIAQVDLDNVFTPYKKRIASILGAEINGADNALFGYYERDQFGSTTGRIVAQARRSADVPAIGSEEWSITSKPEFASRFADHVTGQIHEIYPGRQSTLANNFSYQISSSGIFIDPISGEEYVWFVAHELLEGLPPEGFDRHLIRSRNKIDKLLLTGRVLEIQSPREPNSQTKVNPTTITE